ncbi:hypothetical protein OQA88_4534 [Cercophora sp. LCS_1]
MSGFSVFQPAVGAAVQWLPALGTPELDEMINAVLPGPASIQDKRAHISVDFFMHFQQTGLNSKFYAVPTSFTTPTAPSPAGSAFYDSAYGSGFNASPVVSAEEPKTKSKARATASKKPTASSSRQSAVDFASHPGMRIMTKDGRDVTNSASRGCKTKEQRDHAHLMRIIKACEACKRKKIRCDPSHRKRTASQASSSSSPQAESKATKRMRKAAESPPVPFGAMPDFTPDFFASPEAASASSSFESSPESVDDLWSQFVAFEQEQEQIVNNFTLDDFNFDSYVDPQALLTPGLSDSSASPSQWFTPFSPTTPAPSGPSPPVIASEATSDTLFDGSAQDLTVPYLNPGVPHGTSYQDFNLYSPPADFFLDEEPLPTQKASRPSGDRQSSPSPSTLNDAHVTLQRNSSSDAATVVAPIEEYYSSQRQSSSGDDKRRSHTIRHTAVIGMSPSVTDSWFADQPRDDGGVHDGDGSPMPQPYGVQPIGSRLDGTGRSQSHSPSASTDVHGGSQLSEYLQSQRPSGIVTAGYASRSPTQGQSLLHGSSPIDQPVSSLPSSTSSPVTTSQASSSSGRPLSVGQQLQMLSTRATATLAPTTSSPVIRQSSAVIGPTMVSPAESCSVAATSHLDARATLPTYGQSGVSGMHIETMGAQALVAAFATVLTTLPTRRFGGSDAKSEPDHGFTSLFRLVVFGLVSSLLVLGLQTHFLGQQDGFSILFLASISLASKLQRSLRRPDSTPTPSGNSVHLAPKPTPISNGTIDNVKTKIQPLGYWSGSFRCAVSQRLEAFVPRLSSLSIKL